MREAAVVREIVRDVLEANSGQFQILDEVQQALKDLEGHDLSTLNDEEKAELGRKIDELRAKAGQMWAYTFNVMNDNRRNMQITDKEVTGVLGAVMSAWCDIDAILNTLESKVGRPQHEISVLLREA